MERFWFVTVVGSTMLLGLWIFSWMTEGFERLLTENPFEIPASTIEKAIDKCAFNDELHHINTNQKTANCNNGAVFSLTESPRINDL